MIYKKNGSTRIKELCSSKAKRGSGRTVLADYFPLKNPSYSPSTQGTSLRITRFEKKTKKKKKKKKEYKKSATDTNQQLYQKNYHRGLKDKCS